MSTHQEAIKCPACQLKQFATVTFNEEMDAAIYEHTCKGCGHHITEEQWEHCNASEVV